MAQGSLLRKAGVGSASAGAERAVQPCSPRVGAAHDCRLRDRHSGACIAAPDRGLPQVSSGASHTPVYAPTDTDSGASDGFCSESAARGRRTARLSDLAAAKQERTRLRAQWSSPTSR